MKETIEEVRKVERSDLYNKIHSIVRQIPREDVETDAMDASSCAYDIEQLFYKWQQQNSYSEGEVFVLLNAFNKHTLKLQSLKLGNSFDVKEWFEKFKKK